MKRASSVGLQFGPFKIVASLHPPTSSSPLELNSIVKKVPYTIPIQMVHIIGSMARAIIKE
ncbi:unnamed protein product [Dovyalis caffra]|uniref:Uncharacterized protein n=1 Tax=Dovyalis caffra TaxID=77055 RepID=A0AAV1S598_9ROSI|nr:unnamed protein product [Dovyalis caffra]